MKVNKAIVKLKECQCCGLDKVSKLYSKQSDVMDCEIDPKSIHDKF